MKKQPTEPVQSEAVEWIDPSQSVVFVELFSSQACVFCPEADRLFKNLLKKERILGISCHIDYFDVRENSLSNDFCTKRQSWYMGALNAGPNYTPQMVVNGRYDVVGYKVGEVLETLQDARGNGVLPVEISAVGNGEGYVLSLPDIKAGKARNIVLWLAMYDKPHILTVAEGRNSGKSVSYINIVSALENLGEWDGAGRKKIINPQISDRHGGFMIIAQDANSGKIIAAGQYATAI